MFQGELTVLIKKGGIMSHSYFPKGIAKGEQFFNRTSEIDRLLSNIEQGTHTVLVAPRRYGKSSLAKHVVQKANCYHHEMDLFVAISELDIGNKIINGVTDIIQQVTQQPEQWFNTLRQFFNRADKKWTVGIKGIKLELVPNDPKTVPQNIIDVLQAAEYVLSQKASKAVLYIDEFQEIMTTDIGKAIEGAIRHFAQESQHLVFIFSGSSRRLLQKMFMQRSRPLYQLCDEIRLDRIESSYYKHYINYVAQQTFKQSLDDNVIDRLLALSERHPRYVYLLCAEVWQNQGDTPPVEDDIEQVWQDLVKQKFKDVKVELGYRSHSQLKLLREIAQGNDYSLSGKHNQMALQMTSSTIVQALKALEELDYIEQLDDGQYRLIDPLIKSALLVGF